MLTQENLRTTSKDHFLLSSILLIHEAFTLKQKLALAFTCQRRQYNMIAKERKKDSCQPPPPNI